MLSVMPGSWQSYGLGVVSGSLLSFVPRYGADLAAGAMTGEVLRAINQYGKIALSLSGLADEDDAPPYYSMDGMNEMISPGAGLNELVAPAGIGEMFDGTGITDTADSLEVQPAAGGNDTSGWGRKKRGMGDDGDDFDY